MSDKAKRAIITVAGIEVEVFQLVDLRYVMSQAQAVKAIDEKESLIRQFLTSKQAKYLPSNDYRIDIPTVNDTKGRGGNNRNIMGLTITIASTFWLSRAMKDNSKAEALMYALALEALDRRCDTVFEVVKTEARYEQQTLSAYEEYRQSREYLKDSHTALVNACCRFKFNCAMVHDAITIAVCGKTAAQLRELDVIEGSTSIGLNHIDNCKTLITIAKVKFAFAKYCKGSITHRIIRALREATISE
ncbi:MAG: hypothetical protein V7K67_02190 [Nostoc sp.]|uniref:hypothetical protein n=1 Tax=Nostoc sp. TaxID=1180 RepID=UPI002FF49E47